MVVELYKKSGTYNDKTSGKEKRFTNFYVKCNDQLIPVEPVYFPNEKLEGRDPQYGGRKAVLEAFADELPTLPAKDGAAT
jgi:hypothetical protein